MPRHPPQPEVGIGDRHAVAPSPAVIGEIGDALVGGCRFVVQGGGARQHQLAFGRNGDLGIAQIRRFRRHPGRRLPFFAIFRHNDAQRAVRRNVAFSFAEHAEPLILKAHQVGEGIVRRLVPDLVLFDQRSLGHPALGHGEPGNTIPRGAKPFRANARALALLVIDDQNRPVIQIHHRRIRADHPIHGHVIAPGRAFVEAVMQARPG